MSRKKNCRRILSPFNPNRCEIFNSVKRGVALRFALVCVLHLLVQVEFVSANVNAAMLTTRAVQNGAWNDASTWDNGIPDLSRRAIVPNGLSVSLDGIDNYAMELVIQGNLNVLETNGVARSLTSKWIHVNSGGVFQIGTASNPYDTSDFVVTLTGDDPTEVFNIEGVPNPLTDNTGFLMVAGGGRLQFFGQNKLSFTKLAQTVNAGAGFIVVEKQIDRNFDGVLNSQDGTIDWRVGDEIVIASSSRDYSHEEVRFITGITDLGGETQRLNLNQPLARRHYGEIETYTNSNRTYEIDMRAEVAVLNRTIKIQGESHHDTDNFFGDRARFNAGTGDGFGGHTMIMRTAGQVTIANVQFDLMGQTGRLGRYPVHWHLGGVRTGDVLRGASITNSNNRGVTIHGTDSVVIQDVVLHDIQGHGFFMENGVETGNLFLSNIAFGIHKVGRSAAVGNFAPDLNDPFIVDTHDHVGQNANRFLSSAGFWMTNPDNFWVGNISAGSEGTGFWFIFPDFAIGDSVGDPLHANTRANRTNLRQFDHNSSHSSPVGFNMDRGPDIEVPVGTPLASPFFGRRFLPPNEPQFNYYTAYKHNIGIYQRGDIGNFFENRFADNFTGTFITFTQRITDTLYVGHSQGNPDLGAAVTGHSLYDGANTLSGIHFAGFTASNAHMFRPHGSALRHTSHLFSNTSFEDDGSAFSVSIGTQNGGANHDGAFQTSASAVYDQDGTLTGAAGGGAGYTIVANHPFFYDAGDFRPNGWNAWLTTDTYSTLNILPNNLNADFRFTSPDGDTDTWTSTIGQFGFNTVVKNDAGDYVIEFPQGVGSVTGGFEVLHYTRRGPSGGTVIRFDGIGLNLAPELPELNSLNSLRNASSSAYYRSGDDLFVKFFSLGSRIEFVETVISNVNNPPVAVDDFEKTVAVTPVTIDILANDSDPDGDTLNVVPTGSTVANVLADFQSPNPPVGWQYLWNATGEFGNEANYQSMMWDVWRYRPANFSFPYISTSAAHPGVGPNQDPQGIERFAIAAFTVPEDGVYAISGSSVMVNPQTQDGVNVRAHVTGGSVITLADLFVDEGDFDGTVGFLSAGQTIYLGVGSGGTAGGDGTNWNFSIIKADNSSNGVVVFNPDGTVVYTPNSGFEGTDTFPYEVSDGRGGRDTAIVSVEVAADDVLWDEQPDTTGVAITHQEFPLDPNFSLYIVNDVSFNSAVTIDSISVYFSNDTGNWTSGALSEAVLNIFDVGGLGDPTDGMLVPVSVTGVGEYLEIKASNLNLQLSSGQYYIGLSPIGDILGIGQEFHLPSMTFTGLPSLYRNPGGGFGLPAGTDWGDTSDLAMGYPDASMTITEVTGGEIYASEFNRFRGVDTGGGLSDIQASDDSYLSFIPGFTINSTEAPVWIEFRTTLPSGAATVNVESNANTPGLTCTIEARNYGNGGAYEVIGTFAETFNSDSTETFSLAQNQIDSDGESEVRVGWRQTGFTILFPWDISIDAVSWTVN